MTISLDEINRVTLRQYVPIFRERLAEIGIEKPADWNPTDEELDKLATAYAKAHRAVYGDR